MRKTKRFLATLLAGIMVVAMAGCGSKSGGNKEDVTYSIQGNYIYENEDGGNTDANGVTWYLMVGFRDQIPHCRRKTLCGCSTVSAY